MQKQVPDTVLAANLKIITDAIAAGNADNIPARFVPKTQSKIKTGQYREIDPPIVPENTVVLGDEVRSHKRWIPGSYYR